MSELTEEIGSENKKKSTHIDDFVHYGTSISNRTEMEDYARWLFLHWRLPAITKNALNKFMDTHELYCLYDGECHRVTGASRLGDVWLTKDFEQDTGYQKRVMVDDCSEWSRTPF